MWSGDGTISSVSNFLKHLLSTPAEPKLEMHVLVDSKTRKKLEFHLYFHYISLLLQLHFNYISLSTFHHDFSIHSDLGLKINAAAGFAWRPVYTHTHTHTHGHTHGHTHTHTVTDISYAHVMPQVPTVVKDLVMENEKGQNKTFKTRIGPKKFIVHEQGGHLDQHPRP